MRERKKYVFHVDKENQNGRCDFFLLYFHLSKNLSLKEGAKFAATLLIFSNCIQQFDQ